MVDPGCTSVRESLAELALGILRGDELREATAHLEHCRDCQREVAGMLPVASQLLELIPGTEPPLGFDRRVLREVAPPDRRTLLIARHRALLAAVAAAVAAVIGVSGWLAERGTGTSGVHPQLAAALTAQGHDVGSIEAYGRPLWLKVTVHGAGVSGAVTCEVVHRDGSVTRMGSFDLVSGSGTWSTPDTGNMAGITGARLVDADGHVVAVARFS